MRLRLRSRKAGSIAVHDSQYGPQSTPTITAAQRDALYQQILNRLSNAGDLSLLVELGEPGAARHFAREVSDDLQLVLDVLGWGETSGGGVVELALPTEQLRRTFVRLREGAIEEREASLQGVVQTQVPYERALIVIETCDQVLAAVCGTPDEAAQ